MKRWTPKSVVPAVGIVLVMLIAGCEEQSLSGAEKSRLIADENIQLKQELKRRDREIKKQKGLLGECLQEKKVAEERADKSIEDMMDNVVKDILRENRELREENEKLKRELEESRRKPILPGEPQPL